MERNEMECIDVHFGAYISVRLHTVRKWQGWVSGLNFNTICIKTPRNLTPVKFFDPFCEKV